MLFKNPALKKAFITSLHLEMLLGLLLIAMGLYACYSIALPFLSIIVWAVTLTVLFAPFQHWLDSHCRFASFNALFNTLMIGTIVIVPIVLATTQLAEQVFISARWLQHLIETDQWQHLLNHPKVAIYFNHVKTVLDVPTLLKSVNAWLLGLSATFLKNSTLNVLSAGLIFYVLFFMLRDRHLALNGLTDLSPLSRTDMQAWYQEVNATIKAIFFGTLAIAFIQGFLGGMMFWGLGLPAPLVWGAVMALASIIPMLGAFIVWVPAVIYLMMIGDWGKALTLTLWGVFIIGTVDNLLRPYWVSSQLNLHPLLIFFSITGGVILFGPAGLILGPVTFTTTRLLIRLWKSHRH